ncbi:MAG: FapA family protein [Candidatus Tenebribacter davisii]|jgi:hypothetical protein|nr:FapA family protein [Candidatus Tenebribacter davisii]
MNDLTEGKIYTNADKTLYLTISKDNLSAYLTLKDNSNMIDEKEISSLINSVGIKNGIEEALEYNHENRVVKELDKPFLIARASTQVDSSGISYKFDTESCIKVDEHYEMEDLYNFEKIEKDQILADVSNGNIQAGRKDIFNIELSAEHEAHMNVEEFLGKSVYYSKETNQILSSKSGYPYLDQNNKICVRSDFLSQDIQNTVKTIYGNTTIDGVISNSSLEIFGDLWSKGHISNCMQGGIIVHGDVIMDYAEDSKIFATGRITINKNARNCLIYANGIIEAEKNCSISGGVIQSGEQLKVFSLGSPLQILTEAEIAIAPFLKEQIRLNNTKLIQARAASETDEALIATLAEQLRELQTEFDDEIEKTHNSHSHQITITEKVYPNTNLRILKDILNVSEEKDNITVTVNDTGLEINEVDKL